MRLAGGKTIGITSAEIRSLQNAAAQAGVVASVLYPRRAHPCMVGARQLVQSGALGGLLTLESLRFLTTQVKYRHPDSWLFRRSQAGGGMLLWLGCHCLDLLQHVSGEEITEVGALLATRSGAPIDVDDTVALALRFSSGALGTFHAGYTLAYSGEGYVNHTGNDSYLGFNGRTGRIVWPDLQHPASSSRRSQRRASRQPASNASKRRRPLPTAVPAASNFSGSSSRRLRVAAPPRNHALTWTRSAPLASSKPRRNPRAPGALSACRTEPRYLIS